MKLQGKGSGQPGLGGFTLLELLLVVAIIAVLSGLLLPALSKAKSKARQILCASSQRQLMLAAELYAGDSQDYWVPNGHGDPDDPAYNRTWVAGDSHFFIPGYTNTQYLVDERYAAFAPYIQSPQVYKCPEDKARLRRSMAMNVPQIRSYAMNAYVGWGNDPSELVPGYRVYQRSSDFAADSPSERFVFQEVHPNSICFPAFMTYMPGAEVDGFYHYPSSLHRGGSMVSYADGHIERRRWVDRRTVKPVDIGILAHWDRSPGNTDIEWLRRHATIPVGGDWASVGSISPSGVVTTTSGNGP